MSARLLDGRALGAEILQDARRLSRETRRRRGRAPRLALIAAVGDAAARYLKAKLRACAEAEVEAEVHAEALDGASAPRLLARLARDPAVDAIVVETPYPGGLSAREVSQLLPAEKDAEGVGAQAYGRLFLAKSWKEAGTLIAPCTALAIARLVVSARAPLAGRRALVVGRSATVGRPAAHLLSTLDMTVTLAHSRSLGLERLCREAEVLVAAAGVPELIPASWVRRGAVVVDAGMHSLGARLVGDVAAGAAKRAGAMTPVPGGVGPVTTAVVVLQAARLARARS